MPSRCITQGATEGIYQGQGILGPWGHALIWSHACTGGYW